MYFQVINPSSDVTLSFPLSCVLIVPALTTRSCIDICIRIHKTEPCNLLAFDEERRECFIPRQLPNETIFTQKGGRAVILRETRESYSYEGVKDGHVFASLFKPDHHVFAFSHVTSQRGCQLRCNLQQNCKGILWWVLQISICVGVDEVDELVSDVGIYDALRGKLARKFQSGVRATGRIKQPAVEVKHRLGN
eukprot:m.726493 g.726493  ORF g.726493 m.726493 type:complete len:193 (-) comp58857_c0_seq23:95-673(-)